MEKKTPRNNNQNFCDYESNLKLKEYQPAEHDECYISTKAKRLEITLVMHTTSNQLSFAG